MRKANKQCAKTWWAVSGRTAKGRTPWKRVAVLLSLCVLSVASFMAFTTPKTAEAATSNTINFQARLQTAAGAIVADGNYNIEFKLYNASGSTGSSQGSCTGDTNCLWTETRTGANVVTVKNGYLTVNLGSVTTLPNIDWSQQLWLSMRVGGTGAPSWDPEMNPKLQFTASPYAFAAGKLATTNGSFTSTLSIAAPTGGNQTFTIPDQGAAGNYTLLTTGAASSGYIQNTTSPQTASFNVTGSGTVGGTFTANGNVLFKPGTNSATAFQVQPSSSTTPVLDVDTINSRVGIGNAAPAYTLDVTGSLRSSKYLLGADLSLIPISGSQSAVTSWWGLQLVGNKQSNVDYAPATYGTAGGAGVIIPNQQAASTALLVLGAASQTGDLLTLANSSGTVLAQFDASGNLNLASGVYKSAGVSGSSSSCTGGQLFQNAVVSGGIVTGGSCVAPTTGGVTSVGAISGTSNANGATITGTVLNLTAADGTNGGVLTNTTQNIVGAKTFTTSLATPTLNVTTALQSGGTQRLSSAGALSNITGYAQTSGNATFTQAAGNQLQVTSGSVVPTVDQVNISNTGSTGVTTAGVNGLSIDYKGGAAAIESAGARINVTPGTTSGGTWSSLRLSPTAGAASGVTMNGLKIDNITGGAGTENAFWVGTGWDNILNYNGNIVINGTGNLQSYALSGTYSNNLTLSGTGNVYSGTSATLSGTVQGGTVNATGNLQTGGTTRIDSTGNATVASLNASGTNAGGFMVQGINNSTTGYGIYGFTNNNNNINDVLRLDGSGGTVGSVKSDGTATFNGSINGASLNVGGVASVLAVDAYGYQSSNTGAADAGKYTKLATCTLTAQYNDCRTAALVVGYADGNGTTYRARIDWRVKQQNAFGSQPGVELEVSDVNGFTTGNFYTVVTSAAGPTTAELWGQINTSYTAWAISPVVNTSTRAIWLQNQGMVAAMSAGTQYNAVYSDGVYNSVNSINGYSVNGSAGITGSCTGGQFFQNAAVVGGIITGGSCAAGGGSGVTSVGPISGTSNANGATITGTVLNLTAADGTNGGVLTNTTQNIVGAKTFTTSLATPTLNVTTALQSGGTQRLSSTGALSNITGYAQSSGNATFTQAAGNQLQVTSGSTVPTVDQVNITNTGSAGVTTAGVNGFSIDYKGGAAAVESAGARINVTPGTTSGGTWSSLRIAPTAGAATGVTMNGLKIDNITGGAGTENAFWIGTGWDNILNYNNNVVINGTGILQSYALNGAYNNALSFGGNNTYSGTSSFTGAVTATNAGNSFGGNGSALTSLNAGNISSGTLGFARGGTNATSYTTNGLVYSNGTSLVSTAVGTTGQCLMGNTSSAPTWGTCATGTVNNMQDAYNGSGSSASTPQIQLTTGNGALKIRDASTTVGSMFQLQNSAATATYFAVSSTATTLQNTSGQNVFSLNTSTAHLQVYNPANNAQYADMYWDTTNSEAVFAASSGNTTRVGNGSGNIQLQLTNASDVLVGTKVATLSGAYSANDYSFTRTLTGGANSMTGSVVKIEDTSSGTGTFAPNVLTVNQASTGSSGNLILATRAGSTAFAVNSTGSVSLAASQSVSGLGALTVNSGTSSSLTITGNAASTWSTSAGALTLSGASALNLNAAAGNMSLTAGAGNIVIGTADATATLLVLDTKNTSGDPSGTNGAMYYNSNMGKFRCQENGSWKNCLSSPTNASTADQAVSASTTAYLAGSSIPLSGSVLKAGSTFVWRVSVAKTGTGTAAVSFDVRFGTNGTTADTSRITFTPATGTAATDTGVYTIMATVRSVSATGVIAGNISLVHNTPTAGLSSNSGTINVTSGTFDNTNVNGIIGLSVTTGASVPLTVQQVQVTTTNL